MVELEFYRCFSCKKPIEVERLQKNVSCSCGSRKFVPAYLPLGPFIWYCVKHPGIIARIIRGK
jgi:DNA-directed RNA polymerase subunit RPC12/RpoP